MPVISLKPFTCINVSSTCLPLSWVCHKCLCVSIKPGLIKRFLQSMTRVDELEAEIEGAILAILLPSIRISVSLVVTASFASCKTTFPPFRRMLL